MQFLQRKSLAKLSNLGLKKFEIRPLIVNDRD